MGPQSDLLMLSEHRVKLSPSKFKQRNVIGMVCSPNKDMDS